MSFKEMYWRAALRFGIPLVIILRVSRYFRSDIGVQGYDYWPGHLLVDLATILLVPFLYILALRLYHRVTGLRSAKGQGPTR
jgi:hypothetical protein